MVLLMVSGTDFAFVMLTMYYYITEYDLQSAAVLLHACAHHNMLL